MSKKPIKTYPVTIYYTARKTIQVKARDRNEAITKGSKRAHDLGYDPQTFHVPFLEGDDA